MSIHVIACLQPEPQLILLVNLATNSSVPLMQYETTFLRLITCRPPSLCSASPQLMWSSYSTAPAVIPASALFYATPISGSPFNVDVVPGAASYPYTEAHGDGVTTAAAGVPASFIIQAKVPTAPLGSMTLPPMLIVPSAICGRFIVLGNWYRVY